ncbi:glycoside hydrolase [Phlyctochytrium arcticum]|nr:glycoside hydrolase [Phlyctochytrium arcticum]
MKHAFPLDELNPLTCTGRTKDPDPTNFDSNLNDVLGNFSLTLVDSLDAHAIMNDKAAFEQAVRLVIDTVSFNQDSRVQVFEVTIRLLGALLSAHILASEEKWGFHLDWYAGELLEKATDLADRLMKAFDTPTGIPWPRVNLKTGVPPDETSSTCTAGAGTLILEFGVLSRLTERPEYEALEALWARRSPLGLVGNTLDALTGQWQDTMAGVGAGSDSYYEYLFKAYVLFNEPEYLVTFEQAYFALRRNLLKDDNSLVFWNVDMNSGKIVAPWIDSLGAFLPGMQAFIGDMDTAIRIHQVYVTIWNRYRSLPERYDLNSKAPAIKTYPLRPELIESTYMLYQATKDPYYLYVGEQMLHDIDALTRTPCGFAALSNVEMGYKEDRMESFFLSETLKYLYLLFDEGWIGVDFLGGNG